MQKLKRLMKPSSLGVSTIKQWSMNAKVLIGTEPFWSIPMSWVLFYRPVFLRESVGLSEVQIGFLFTVLSFFSLVGSLCGGYMADRFGRKRVFMIFDSYAWIPSLAFLIITQDLWFALAAYVMEGITTVGYSPWECLLAEDTEPQHRASVYGSIAAIFNLGILLTPFAGYIIGLCGVDPGSRMLFALALASMIPMNIIREIYLEESKLGTQIQSEKSFEGLKGYFDCLSIMRKHKIIAALLLIFVIEGFYRVVSGFLPLYLIDVRGLGLGEATASLVPAASSISSLIISLLVVSKLTSRSGYVKTLTSSYIIGFCAILLLVGSPRGYISLSLLSGILLGFINASVFFVSRTFLTNEIESIESRARAKLLSIALTLSSLINLPLPVIVGHLFSLHPKLPFLALFVAFVLGLATLVLIKSSSLANVRCYNREQWDCYSCGRRFRKR